MDQRLGRAWDPENTLGIRRYIMDLFADLPPEVVPSLFICAFDMNIGGDMGGGLCFLSYPLFPLVGPLLYGIKALGYVSLDTVVWQLGHVRSDIPIELIPRLAVLGADFGETLLAVPEVVYNAITSGNWDVTQNPLLEAWVDQNCPGFFERLQALLRSWTDQHGTGFVQKGQSFCNIRLFLQLSRGLGSKFTVSELY